MSGVWRIVMKPLIDDVPVVAGMVIAMKAPPQVCFAFAGVLHERTEYTVCWRAAPLLLALHLCKH